MFPQIDPSKLDPKALSELTQLIQQLPTDRMMKLQTLMHNMMAGINVQKELEEFEKTLPPGFKEKIATIYYQSYIKTSPTSDVTPIPSESDSITESVEQARMTVLNGVANGTVTPEEAYKVLF